MSHKRRLWCASVALASALCALCLGQEPPAPAHAADEKLARILKGVGESVERFHAGLFSIRFTETWRWEELSKEFTPKKTREYVYDDVVVREEGPAGARYGKVVRRLLKANGKPARDGRRDKHEPGPTSHTMLGDFLPERLKEYDVTLEGEETYAGRRCYRLGYTVRPERETGAVWKGRTFRVYAPRAGRLWVDAENFDVLGWELRLPAGVEFESPGAVRLGPFGRFGPSRKLRYLRDDYTVRFRRVEFKDPAQTLLLPESAEWVRVIEGASRPRVRIRQTFTDYQRFVSDVKIIEDAGPENF